MKYIDFHKCLTLQVGNLAYIGPAISIKVGSTFKISIEKFKDDFNHNNKLRFVIFPIKIYGENVRHLNILILDKKTKIIERYEPFNEFLNLNQIDGLIESLLYKLMNERKIYFLWYFTSLNNIKTVDDKNCGFYCIEYTKRKINFLGRKSSSGF